MTSQYASQAAKERLPWQQGSSALVDFLEQRDEQVELCRQALEAALTSESSRPSPEEAAAAAEAAVSQALDDIASLGAAYGGWNCLHFEPARSTSVALATQLQSVSSALVRTLSQAALQLLQAGDAHWAGPQRLAFWLRTLAAAAWLLQAVAEGCCEGKEGLGLKQATPVELISALLQLMLAGIRHIGSVSLQMGCQLHQPVGTAGSSEAQAGCAQQAQRAAASIARLSLCFPALELAARQLADRRRRPMEPSPRGTILGAALSMLRALDALGYITQEDGRLLFGLEEAAEEASMLPFVLMDCTWLTAVLRSDDEPERAAPSSDSTRAIGGQCVEPSITSPETLRVPTPLVGRESRRRQLGE